MERNGGHRKTRGASIIYDGLDRCITLDLKFSFDASLDHHPKNADAGHYARRLYSEPQRHLSKSDKLASNPASIAAFGVTSRRAKARSVRDRARAILKVRSSMPLPLGSHWGCRGNKSEGRATLALNTAWAPARRQRGIGCPQRIRQLHEMDCRNSSYIFMRGFVPRLFGGIAPHAEK